MTVDELVENLVWSATFVQRNRLRVMHDAHQAARRKLAFRYGKAFTEMERMAPMRAIARELVRGREVRLWRTLTRSFNNESFGSVPPAP